jgi:hypothetical protein
MRRWQPVRHVAFTSIIGMAISVRHRDDVRARIKPRARPTVAEVA